MDLSKNGYRLPTEMEWMWAAMGADKTVQPNTTGYAKAFAGSNGSNDIGDYAWYGSNPGKTHEAGRKNANELGLQDMTGNVSEWCWDWYAGSIPAGDLTDFTGADSGSHRVRRGGGWYDYASNCAVAIRSFDSPYSRGSGMGFRFVCP
jgi:formylglycine-generating enzyme required for sulfatase activity